LPFLLKMRIQSNDLLLNVKNDGRKVVGIYISTTLAHIHSEEFNEQSKKKKNTTKKKIQNPPIQSKYINFIIYH
jgi:hypothetical protein